MEGTVEPAAPILPAATPDDPSATKPIHHFQFSSSTLASLLAFFRLLQLAVYFATLFTAYFGLCKGELDFSRFSGTARFPWPDTGCSIWSPNLCKLLKAWQSANLAALVAGLAAGVMIVGGVVSWVVVDLGWGGERRRWVKWATVGLDGVFGILAALSGALVIHRTDVHVVDDITTNFKAHLIAVGTMLLFCSLSHAIALLSNAITTLKSPSTSVAVPALVDPISIRQAFTLAREALRPRDRSDYSLFALRVLLACISVCAACVALAGLNDLTISRTRDSPFPWLALSCGKPKYVSSDWCTSPVHAWQAGNVAALVSLTAVGLMVIGTVVTGAVEAGKYGDGGWKALLRTSPLGYHVAFVALSIVAAWHLFMMMHQSDWFTSSFGWAITRMESIAGLLLVAALLNVLLLATAIWKRFPKQAQPQDIETGVSDTDVLVQRESPPSDG